MNDITLSARAIGHRSITTIALGFAAIVIAFFYPNILSAFSRIIDLLAQNNGEYGRGSLVMTAILLMSLIFFIPVLAFWSIHKINQEDGWKHPRALRRILHFVCASSPFYTMIVLGLFKAGLGQWQLYAWYLFTGVAGILLLYFSKKTTTQSRLSQTEKEFGGNWRFSHGVAALILMLAFVIVHLFNHMLALWSLDWQAAAMNFLRKWYRAAFIEPIILLLTAGLMVSGIKMTWHYTRRPSDFFRLLQTCAGVYLFMFFCSHISAVFLARMGGEDTDWVFAVGTNGLFHGFVMLFPYYALASFLILLHASLGLRKILLDRNWVVQKANQIFYGLAFIGLIVSLIISLATTGIEL